MRGTARGRTALLCSVAISCFFSGAPSSRSEITFDGSLGGTPRTIRGPNMVIPERSGFRPRDANGNPGPNLFHSFTTFDITTTPNGIAENATFHSRFTGWRRPRNIIGRVTGNAESIINGGLRSNIEGANIWLINPLGVVFGENAQVDVPAGFHVSSGNYVELDDGKRFNADVGTDPQILSVAPPVAFGFPGPSQGNISIRGGSLRVGTGASLSLVGGGVDMDGGTVTANGGRLIVASTASAGEVVVDGSDLQMNGFNELGDINLTNEALVDAGGPSGGRILIRGGNLEIDDSQVTAVVDQEGSGDGVIDLDLANDANLNDGASIVTATTTASNAGDIRIRVGNRMDIKGGGVDDFSIVSSETTGAGNAGSIDVDVGDRLRVRDNAAVRSTTRS